MLQKNNSMKLSDYFMRLMLTMIGLIMVISVVLTGVLYYNFRNVSLSGMQEYEKTSVLNDSRTMAEMTDMASIVSAQLLENAQVQQILSASSAETLPSELPISSIIKNNTYHSFIHSVYILNVPTDTFYSVSSHVEVVPITQAADQQCLQFLNNSDAYPSLTPVSRTLPSDGEDIPSKHVFSYIYYDNLNSITGVPQSAMIINVNASWLGEQLALYQESDVSDLVLDKNGVVLAGPNAGEDLSGEKYISTILSSNALSGSSVETIGSEKSLVSYARDPGSGTIFVRTKNYVAVQNHLFNFTFVILASVCLILIIGFLISVYLSRRLSQPITKMADKIAHLESRNVVSQRALKQDLLNNLLAATHLSSKEIGMKFSDCKINISDSAPVFMFLMKIDRWKKLCSEYSQADRSLLKYGIMNITEELISARFVCDIVDAGEDSIVILCNYPTPAPNKEELTDVLSGVNRALTTHLSISVTFCVGYVVSDVSQVSHLFEDTKKAISHRLFSGHGSIIFPGDIHYNDAADYVYPVAKERQLIDSLMLEKTDKVLELYGEIIAGVRTFPSSTAITAVQRLAMAINLSLGNNHLNNHLLTESELLSSAISEAETFAEINLAYEEFFNHISKTKAEQKSRKYEDLIKTIHDLIESGYADGNLSVNSISEEVGMSSVYLGRLYKKLTGRSINESINEVRINEAKHLLADTNLTVNEIVEKIGFTNSSYFYTVFKKYQGIAPNDYRQKHKKSVEC